MAPDAQSNILVAVGCLHPALRPAGDHLIWRGVSAGTMDMSEDSKRWRNAPSLTARGRFSTGATVGPYFEWVR